MGRQRTPTWLQGAATIAIRTALAAPLVLPPQTAIRGARSLARVWALSRLNVSRFERTTRHIKEAFPELCDERIRELGASSYEHLFALGMELGYTSRLLTEEGFTRHLFFEDISPAIRKLLGERPCVLITGHCGNWELMGYSIALLGFPLAAVYRPLDLQPLDRWVRDMRARRGLALVSKFGAMRALPPVLQAKYPIGLVADQSGGDRGLFVPFFGRLTSTYKSVGLLAMQAGAHVICGTARRMRSDESPPSGAMRGNFSTDGPESLRYAIEITDSYGPEDWAHQPDPLFYLTARYRRAMETMIRRAPDQYLWMHRIWRSRAPHERNGKPFPPQLREKLLALPWMSESEVERIIARSARDAETVAAGLEP